MNINININELESELSLLLDEIDYDELNFEDSIEVEQILKDAVRRMNIFKNNHLNVQK